jgi:hypothetical protein
MMAFLGCVVLRVVFVVEPRETQALDESAGLRREIHVVDGRGQHEGVGVSRLLEHVGDAVLVAAVLAIFAILLLAEHA